MDFSWVIPVIGKVIGFGIVGCVGILVFALLVVEIGMVFGFIFGVRCDDEDKDRNRRFDKDKKSIKSSDW